MSDDMASGMIAAPGSGPGSDVGLAGVPGVDTSGAYPVFVGANVNMPPAPAENSLDAWTEKVTAVAQPTSESVAKVIDALAGDLSSPLLRGHLMNMAGQAQHRPLADTISGAVTAVPVLAPPDDDAVKAFEVAIANPAAIPPNPNDVDPQAVLSPADLAWLDLLPKDPAKISDDQARELGAMMASLPPGRSRDVVEAHWLDVNARHVRKGNVARAERELAMLPPLPSGPMLDRLDPRHPLHQDLDQAVAAILKAERVGPDGAPVLSDGEALGAAREFIDQRVRAVRGAYNERRNVAREKLAAALGELGAPVTPSPRGVRPLVGARPRPAGDDPFAALRS